jgi:hypothetical protein
MTTPQPITAVRVGKPYSATRTVWPEGADYNYRSDQHELRLFLASPTNKEVIDITKRPSAFALAVSGDVIFLCYRFGGQPWGDATYSIHLVPADQRTIPPVTSATEHALLTVILVCATTGYVRGLRAVTFPPAFTQALHSAIRQQAARPYPGQADYDAQIASIYAVHDSAGIASALATVTCQGGRQ